MQKLLFILLLIWANSAMSQSALRLSSDTVKVAKAELVVQNSTKDIAGYLYNIDNGKTAFKKLGRSVQFKVGTLNFPKAGDTVYVNREFKGQHIKVWRNGLLQYRDNVDGVGINSDSGWVYFRPALTATDRIYIEAISGIDLTVQGQSTDDATTRQLGKLAINVFDNGNGYFTLRWAVNSKTLYLSPSVFGIGASTLYGYGVNSPYKLGERIFSWLSENTSNPSWINVAVFGQTSQDLSSTADGGVVGHNIDSAMNANPDFIFASLASNDAAQDFSVNKSIRNYRKIDSIAMSRGIPVFFTTTQPRTIANAGQQTILKQVADSIRKIWPDRFVEAFAKVVDSTAATDAAINVLYGNGDGVHLNPEGVQFIATSFAERLVEYFKPIKGVNKYIIDTSTNGSNWAQYDVVIDQNTVKKIYPRPGKKELYFRVRQEYANGTLAEYSNPVKLKEYIVPPPPLVFDHRLLIDLGGDGVKTSNGTRADGKPTVSPDFLNHYWNNWFGDGTLAAFVTGASIDGLRTASNESTNIGLKLIGKPEGIFGNTPTKALNFNGPGVAIGEYPAEAVYDNLYFHNSSNGSGNIIRLRGLSKNNTYYVKLWGVRIDTARESLPRVLDAKLGTDAWTSVKSIETRWATTDSTNYKKAIYLDGFTGVDSMDINLRVGAGSTFGHLSVMDIGIVGDLPPIPYVILRDTTTTSNKIQLKGAFVANGATISNYQWSQISGPNTAIIANDMDNPTNISNLTNGTYIFKLTVTTTNGKIYSTEGRVIVYPDNGGKKTLRVNFSYTPAPPIPGWLNVYGTTTTGQIVVTDNVTNWTVDNVSGGLWNLFASTTGSNTEGTTTGNNSGIIPDIALNSYWFNYSTRYVAGQENLILSGLDPTKTYTLKLYAARNNSTTGVKYGCWRVNGGSELLLDALENTTNEKLVENVSPNAEGKIRIAVVAPTNATLYGTFSFMNALILIEN
jgi:lysophospholipase L1-like esterase